MADLPLVQDDKSFEYLLCYFLRIDVRSVLRDVFAQIPVLNEFHGNMERISVGVLKPAEEANEQVRMLVIG